MRIEVSLLQFSMFLFGIHSVVNFMGYTFVVTVTPSLAEVVEEVRNIFLRHQMMRQNSTSVQLRPMAAYVSARDDEGLA
jgi:hypothetical protein